MISDVKDAGIGGLDLFTMARSLSAVASGDLSYAYGTVPGVHAVKAGAVWITWPNHLTAVT
ncbi:MAG: hypothetical protein R2861_10620 [Desulfobacterales bacterium]